MKRIFNRLRALSKENKALKKRNSELEHQLHLILIANRQQRERIEKYERNVAVKELPEAIAQLSEEVSRLRKSQDESSSNYYFMGY